MLVSEIMSRPVVTASQSETVAQAASRMREQRVGSVVVVDGERAVGEISSDWRPPAPTPPSTRSALG